MRVAKSSKVAGRNRIWAVILWLLLIGSLLVFWVLPTQLGPRPVQVNFEKRD
jgi:hypothetical protein